MTLYFIIFSCNKFIESRVELCLNYESSAPHVSPSLLHKAITWEPDPTPCLVKGLENFSWNLPSITLFLLLWKPWSGSRAYSAHYNMPTIRWPSEQSCNSNNCPMQHIVIAEEVNSPLCANRSETCWVTASTVFFISRGFGWGDRQKHVLETTPWHLYTDQIRRHAPCYLNDHMLNIWENVMDIIITQIINIRRILLVAIIYYYPESSA